MVLADDHPMYMAGVQAKLSSMPADELGRSLEIVGEAADGIEAIRLVEAHRPDVLVLDVEMPRMNGIDCLRALVGQGLVGPASPTRVLVLSGRNNKHTAALFQEHGASGYLTKEHDFDQVAEGIRAVANGEARWFVSPRRAGEELTEKEMQVLRLMCTPCLPHEVAEQLAVSIHTVRSHIRNVNSKFGTKSIQESIVHAFKTGLVQP